MREFDEACLTPVTPLSGDEIRAIRLQESLSQAVFAHYLNVNSKQVSDWERGIKRPGGATLKLLTAETEGMAASSKQILCAIVQSITQRKEHV